MQSDRFGAAQLPFWPGLVVKPAIAPKARAAREPRESRARRKLGKPETPEERAVRERLQERMSARVALKNNKGRGSFTVHFASYDQLDEIMRRIDA